MSLLAVAVAGLIVGWTVRRERRGVRALSTERSEMSFLVAALETLSLELRCGAAPLDAFSAVETNGACASLLLAGAAGSATMSEAAGWLDRGPPPLRALAGAVRLAESSGTSLADLADAIAGPLREEQQADRELADALAGVRSSANLLTGLPLLGILLASGIGADPIGVLFHTAAGSACLVLGTGLGGLARVWTGALVQRARVAGQA